MGVGEDSKGLGLVWSGVGPGACTMLAVAPSLLRRQFLNNGHFSPYIRGRFTSMMENSVLELFSPSFSPVQLCRLGLRNSI